ncbi:DUF1778 domain-containing protein [Comamonas sp. NLF-1-9]|uniref:type II toxin -antitoxin system TacA 1-like antitoxin n=1 Tax=Comamonas sp. NLF-1-9 TaxID=2853163 RepID=UPI001C486297|nr:DUF1778 domain-containing protein [Comamonas sp. NLF-1-9]QXL85227.1 DUF1778 domain-containing protein [Comamonas sp. NLF-1-9]
MSRKSAFYTVRIDPEERALLEKVAARAGYRSLSAFLLAAAREKAQLIENDDVLSAMEERMAATFGRVMQMIQTVNDGVQVNVSQVHYLAQAFFTCVPQPPPEAVDAAIDQAKIRHARWQEAVAADVEGKPGA